MKRNRRAGASAAHAAPALRLQSRLRGREGFTLIEMLAVIAIITLTTGIFVGGTMAFREVQVNRSTEDRLNRLQIGLNKEYEDVVQKGQREKPPQAVIDFCQGNEERAKAVHIAALLRAYLPDRFDEVVAFDINGFVYQPKNAFKSVQGMTFGTRDEQSAILLYLILNEQSISGSSGDSGATNENMVFKAPNRDFQMFRDPRDNPVVFRRWAQSAELDLAPYSNIKPAPAVNFIDPLDPKGLVFTPVPATGWDANQRDKLKPAPRFLVFENRNRVPSVVAVGKNKTFDNFAPGADDLVGYRLDRFGKRGK